jgi:hypothetical protein
MQEIPDEGEVEVFPGDLVNAFGAPRDSNFKPANRLSSLEGRTISFYDNRKKGVKLVFDVLKKYCERNFPSTDLVYVQGVDPGLPAPEILLTRIRETEGVILGVGDCGSCSYALARTSIAVENSRIPSATIITRPFLQLVSSVLSADGATSIPIIVLDTEFAVGNLNNEGTENLLKAYEDEIFYSLQERPVKVVNALQRT